MNQITDTLSKEIIAAAEGEIVGIVTNGYADRRLTRIRGYKVSCDERDEPLFLPLRRILGEKDALIVRNRAALGEACYSECPIGAKVYDTAGTRYGVLRDVIYEGQSGRILALVADEKEIAPDRVIAFGKGALVLRAPAHEHTLFRKRISAPALRKAVKSIVTPDEVPSLPDEKPAPEPLERTASPREGSENKDGEYAFLLGRRVTKSIGEGHIAEKDQEVTPDVLRRARLNGKLVELTVNSRRG